MLSIDIETLGRITDVPLPPITCICMYDAENGKRYSLRFWKLSNDGDEYKSNVATVLEKLDTASSIIGYNAVLFDLEYIKLTFGVPPEQMTAWVKKCVDPFMCAKYILRNTCKLNDMLALNNMGAKTGSGSDAIILAQEEKWQELMDYCIMDVILTFELTTADCIMFSDSLKGHWVPNSAWTFEWANCSNSSNASSKCVLQTLKLNAGLDDDFTYE